MKANSIQIGLLGLALTFGVSSAALAGLVPPPLPNCDAEASDPLLGDILKKDANGAYSVNDASTSRTSIVSRENENPIRINYNGAYNGGARRLYAHIYIENGHVIDVTVQLRGRRAGAKHVLDCNRRNERDAALERRRQARDEARIREKELADDAAARAGSDTGGGDLPTWELQRRAHRIAEGDPPIAPPEAQGETAPPSALDGRPSRLRRRGPGANPGLAQPPRAQLRPVGELDEDTNGGRPGRGPPPGAAY